MAESYKAFNIYKPAKGFVWTRERIIGMLFLVPFFMMAFMVCILQIPDKEIPKWVGWILSLPAFIGLLCFIINFWLPSELKGKIEGKLIFEKDKIIIENAIFLTKDLKYIEINKKDYRGQMLAFNGLNGVFSQGCNNELIIGLLNGTKQSCFFQIQYSREMLHIINQLEHYTKQGLLNQKEGNKILN